MTHASVPKEMRDQLGITDGLIRISCGLESADDLIKDLDQALRAVVRYWAYCLLLEYIFFLVNNDIKLVDF